MADWSELLEHGIPDLIDAAAHPAPLAAELDFLAGRFEPGATAGADMPATLVARSAAARGDAELARRTLAALDIASLEPQELVAMAWTAARVGPIDVIPPLLGRFATADEFLTDGALPLGPRPTLVGQLHAAHGDVERGVAELEHGIVVGDARAPIWGALARLELARVLLCLGAIDPTRDTSRIGGLLTSASTFFRAGGYRALLHRCDDLTRPDRAAGSPLVGELNDCGHWFVGFGVMPTVELRASKGLAALRHLIECAPRAAPALELDRVVNGDDHAAIAAMMTAELGADTAPVGEVADVEGIAADLRGLLFDDAVRSRISKLIHRTIARLDTHHPVLGAHLRHTVHTGHICRYEPIGDHPVRWRFGAGAQS